MGSSHWNTHDNPTTSKITYDDIKESFLAKEWNSFHVSWKSYITSTSRIFSNTNMICN
jgi:hypothetical protein